MKTKITRRDIDTTTKVLATCDTHDKYEVFESIPKLRQELRSLRREKSYLEKEILTVIGMHACLDSDLAFCEQRRQYHELDGRFCNKAEALQKAYNAIIWG